MGVGMGWLVAWIFRKLKKSSTGSQTRTSTLRGSEGTVLLSIGPEKVGKIRLLVDGSHLDLLAKTHDTTLIERNQKVLVVSVEGGVAQITRLPPGSSQSELSTRRRPEQSSIKN